MGHSTHFITRLIDTVANRQGIIYKTIFYLKNEQKKEAAKLELYIPECLKNACFTQFTVIASVAQPGRAAAS